MPKGIPGSCPSDPMPTLKERFWIKVDQGEPADCWPWTGAILRNGYGYFGIGDHKTIVAHRWAYQDAVGLIPDGLEIDHVCHNDDATCLGGKLCRHRRCCNPAHLEAVTRPVNLHRGHRGGARKKTHCKRGHERTPENTYSDRSCRICRGEQNREWKRRMSARERG